MAAETMMARQLTYFAAREKDAGRRCDIEAGMAKLLAARVAWSNADNALQIHGGNGYALEYPISRVLCDARILNDLRGRGGDPGAGDRARSAGAAQLSAASPSSLAGNGPDFDTAAYYIQGMSGFFTSLLVVAMLAVLGALFLGLFAMVRGGEFNAKYGNRLMRLRVILQGVALVMFVLAVIASSA